MRKPGNYQTNDEYIWKGFLVLNPYDSPKWRQRGTMGGPGDRLMEIEIRAPRSLWDIPTMKATISVSDEDAQPLEIDTEAAAEALRSVIGAEIRLEVIEPDGET